MTLDLTGVDLAPITASIQAAVPVVIPVAVGLLGLRKGISFLMNQLRGA